MEICKQISDLFGIYLIVYNQLFFFNDNLHKKQLKMF